MPGTYWFDEHLDQHQQRAAYSQEVRRQRRRRVRDLARITLAVMLVALSVLAVEIGRKAVTVMQHAQTVETVRTT